MHKTREEEPLDRSRGPHNVCSLSSTMRCVRAAAVIEDIRDKCEETLAPSIHRLENAYAGGSFSVEESGIRVYSWECTLFVLEFGFNGDSLRGDSRSRLPSESQSIWVVSPCEYGIKWQSLSCRGATQDWRGIRWTVRIFINETGRTAGRSVGLDIICWCRWRADCSNACRNQGDGKGRKLGSHSSAIATIRNWPTVSYHVYLTTCWQ